MFILKADPSWMVPSMVIVALTSFIFLIPFLMMLEKPKFSKVIKGTLGTLGFGIFFSIFIVLGIGINNPDIATFDNPYSASEKEREDLAIDSDKLETTIAESIKVDKAQIESDNNVKVLNGDLTDFTAVQDGKLIEGKFYYTESTLEILVSGETDIIEHVSIPVK